MYNTGAWMTPAIGAAVPYTLSLRGKNASGRVASLDLVGLDDGAVAQQYAGIGGDVVDDTAGAEYGRLIFEVVVSGSVTTVAKLDETILDVVGMVSSSNINTQDLEVNGPLVASELVKCTGVQIESNIVLSQQGAAIADATDAATTMARLNDLLAAVRQHGLIAP